MNDFKKKSHLQAPLNEKGLFYLQSINGYINEVL